MFEIREIKVSRKLNVSIRDCVMLCHAGTILLVASQFMSYYNVAHETWHGQIGPPKTFPLHNSTQH